MKKSFEFPNQLDITVTCASGVEKATKSELKRIGYDGVPAINGALTFKGSPLDVARANVFLRTADRVYIKITEFVAQSFDDLFDGVKSVKLENYFPSDAKITVNGKCVKSKLFAISACQSIVKKAVADRLCSVYGLNRLYETGAEYHIEFAIFKDVCSLYLNTSGAGLHKRGYRDMVGIAPIKETLASSLLLMSDFYKNHPFADPFCGSGTIPIEAALTAKNRAPGLERAFQAMQWPQFPADVWEEERELARSMEFHGEYRILGTDIDPKAIEIARENARRAGVDESVQTGGRDC